MVLTKMKTDSNLNYLIDGIINGEKRAIARTITKIENETEDYIDLLDQLYSHIGKAHRIGVTGPPGAGKSTFTNQLTKLYRLLGLTVGVIAVDPSSPFTGGAILGDRIRMKEVCADPGVFIRSMATRGSMGGLVRQATEVADVLDASGKDVIIYETVGVGQIELDIMSAADTIIVMTVPDAGDVIQGMKAGLMEIGDIFVINKADLAGADRMKADLEYVLHLRGYNNGWNHQVWMAESRIGQGIKDIFDNAKEHFEFLKQNKILRQKQNQRIEERVRHLVNNHINQAFWSDERLAELQKLLENSKNQISPYSIAGRLIGK